MRPSSVTSGLEEVECSSSCENPAVTQMEEDHEGRGDVDSPGDDTFREAVPSGASLDCSAGGEFENHVDGLEGLETSAEEHSSNEGMLPHKCPAEEDSRQSGQWAVEEKLSVFDNKENLDVNMLKEESVLEISPLESDRHQTSVDFVECLKDGKARKPCARRAFEIQVPAFQVVESAITLMEGAGVDTNQDEQQEDNEKQLLQQKLKEALEKVHLLESRMGDEQLRLSFQRKEKMLLQEKEVVITALEESELKSQEQSVKLKELENTLSRLKDQTARMEKRCTTAESKAEESSSLVYQLQSKLDSTSSELYEAKNASVQLEAMKLRLQECEKALSTATTQRTKAAISFRELQLRDEHVEEVEHGSKELEERLKWRNEQFQSLEDAHSKVKLQFKEKRSEWDTEKSRLFSDIDLLQSTLDSKEGMLLEAQKQLEMVHHALSREESRRKVLELEMASLEHATAGFEEAQFTLETLRDQSSTEIGSLRNTLAAKDRQLKDLQVKHIHLQQEYDEVSSHNELALKDLDSKENSLMKLTVENKTLLGKKESLEQVVVQLKQKRSEWDAEKARLFSDFDSLQSTVDSKECLLREAQKQVEMVHHALSREESRRKVLELEMAESRQSLEQATAGVEEAQFTLETLKEQSSTEISSLRNTLGAKDRQLKDLQVKHTHLQQEYDEVSSQKELALNDLDSKETSLMKLTVENKTLLEEKESLEQVAVQLKERRSEWDTEKARLFSDFDSLQSTLDSKEFLLREAQKQVEVVNHALSREESRRKVLELEMAERCQSLEQATAGLEEAQFALETLREQSTTEIGSLRNALGATDRQLKDLQVKHIQMGRECNEVSSLKELALKDLDSKETSLMKLTVENKTLLEEKESLEQVVHVLEAKKVGLLQEVESSRTRINELCDKYDVAQSNLASGCNEVKDLRAKLQNFHTVSVQLIQGEEQIRDLEGYLKAAKAIAQDKEEKLAASEWAVQQLALDVGKAKAALAQKDREEALVRDELADVERQLRAKEGALIEMECYLEDALISRSSMQTEVEQLRQRMEDLDRGAAEWKRKEHDMTTQLDVVGAVLEEKREALTACEMEIKRGSDLREVMEGAIESLKLQLEDEQRALSSQQEVMNRLCEDLERSKGEANSSSGLVKELHGRLQQLEQSSDDRINQFHSTLSELKGELSVAHLQLEKYQNSTRLLTEESSRYKEKCEALLDLNTRKDSSLKDMEAQLLSVQASALEQSKMLEQRDQDLQRAKQQRQCQEERQISLEESLSRVQSQRSELQLDNEELLLELRKLRVQHDASSTEVALMSKEIQSLELQLEQTRLVVAQEGDTQMLMTTLADELESSRRAVQEREARLRAMKAALDEARENYQVLEANLAGKESETEILMEKLSTVETRYKDAQDELSRSLGALAVSQSTLSEKSEIISLHLGAINAMEVEIASLKDKAELSYKEASSSTQELRAALSRAMVSEKNALKAQETLEGVQAEWLEMKSRVSAAESEVLTLKQQLEDVEGNRLQGHLEVVRMSEVMMRMERDLIEERGNVQRLSMLEHDLNQERTKVAESASLISDLQAQVEEWKRIADDSAIQKDTLKQEVLLIKEAMMSVEHSLIEDRGITQLLSRAEGDLVEERRRVVESAALISDLMAQVEGWKTKAEDAANEGVRVNKELQSAMSTISNLMLQIEAHQANEKALNELNDSLQVDINVVQEEALARKEKMESFLHELEQSQEGEKELLQYLQTEHKRLVADIDNGGGFEPTFGTDACEQTTPLGDHGNTDNIRVAKLGIKDDDNKPTFQVEVSEASTDDCTLARVNEALEQELEILRFRTEESQREAHELSGKLDAAVSNVTAKNLIIKQVNDEILGLRSQVKALEEETLSLRNSIYGEGHLSSTDTRNLPTGKDGGQQKTSPGKRKAEIQEDLNNYVELCDSLVRKNIRLEKQLDSLQRKNRGLQKQVEGLQTVDRSSLDDPVLLAIPRTNNENVVKPAAQERRMVSLQDICKGTVLGEIDENAVPGSFQRCQMSRRPPISPAVAILQKKAKRVKGEL